MDVFADREILLGEISSGGPGDVQVRHFGEERVRVGRLANADGNVSLIAQSGPIELLEAEGAAIVVGGDGVLVLSNDSSNGEILIRGAIESDRGDVQIRSLSDVTMSSTSSLRSTAGEVSVTAGSPQVPSGATINLQDGSSIDVGPGTILLWSSGDIAVSSLSSDFSGDAITITSLSGALADSGDRLPDLIADSGIVRISTSTGIGDGDPLETQIEQLNARVTSTGSIELSEATGILLDEVVTTDGLVSVTASGDLHARRVFSQNASGLDGNDPRDIRLTATAPTSDIRVQSIEASNGADVRLVAANDVLAQNTSSLIQGDDLFVRAGNDTVGNNLSVQLFTNVNDLDLAVSGSIRGDVLIDEIDSIRIASSDRNDDREVVSTGNGEIRIRAGQTIASSESGLVDDGDDLRGDVEISAGGANGRIRFNAGAMISLGDSVQLFAERTEIGAVRIDAPSIVLGEAFQIETGDEIGVARQFAPRPEDGLTGTAFYDFTSIVTNRLEQASVNDAIGVLTVDIGSAGERGLTMNIDWGSPTARFQQIDGLSGDAPPFR